MLHNPPELSPEVRETLARLLWGNRQEGRHGAYLEAVWTLGVGGGCHYYDDGTTQYARLVAVSV
jgi:hypothetical protein